LPAWIPSLQEFIAWSSSRPTLRAVFLDIKVPTSVARLASPMIARVERMLADAPGSVEWVYLVADSAAFEAVDRTAPHGRVSFDAEPPSGLVLSPCSQGSVSRALLRGNDFASIIVPFTSTIFPWSTARRIIECDLEKARKGRHVRVVAGTVNDPEKLECLIMKGIDGIITDYPDRMRSAIGAVRGPGTTGR
jgi:glycerophosphoryl diester phosphodiesterase